MSPIATNDLVYRLSGGAANTDPDASLGGAMSTAAGGVIVSGAVDNVFDDISGDEGAAGDVEYRGIYVKNAHATLTLQSAILWIEQVTDSPDDEIAIALADEAVGASMETIANESTAPVGPAFTAPVSKATGLAIGDIAAGSFKGIWIRRTVDASAAAQDAVTFIVRCEGDSGA